VSTLFDREHPPRRYPRGADEDTVEIPVPDTDIPDSGDDVPAEQDGGRLRPTIRARRLQAVLLLAAYIPASLGSTWLLFLAFLRTNLTVMLVMCGALVWFVPDTVRLARWLHRLDHGARRPRLSRLQNLVASVLAGVYAWLLVDWLLHQ